MREIFSRSVNGKLRKLTAELRALDQRLKSNPSLEGAWLREFRQALDNVRLTAWSVNELLNARQSGKNQQAVISFLTAERLRRFSQMARDLSRDLEQDGTSWPAQAVRDLENSLAALGARLTTIGESEDAERALR
jgi:hypothetical protein